MTTITSPWPQTSLVGCELPLAPIESYFLADQTPQYPLTFCTIGRFTGEIERAAFERATALAACRNPLLAARVQRSRSGKLVWKVDHDVCPQVAWVGDRWPLVTSSLNQIDLSHEHGFRTWVGQWQGYTRVVWQFHHACTDGIGAFQFVSDLFALYAQEVGQGEGLELRTLKLETLANRLKIMPPEGPSPPLWKKLRYIATYATQFLARRPIVLQPSPASVGAEAVPAHFPVIETQVLDETKAAQLRAWSTARGATANDSLLAVLYLTLAQWQQLHPGPGNWLRVLMPTNLRGLMHQATPACNVLGFAFLDRRPAECKSAAALLPEIVRQTGLIKKHLLGRSFLDAVAVARSLGMLKWLTTARHANATAVFSNPGDLTRRLYTRFARRHGKCAVGDLLLEEISGFVPLRRGTRVSLLVSGNQTRLTLTWGIDPQFFTAADRVAFITCFEENLQATVAS